MTSNVNDASVFKIGTGHFYRAVSGTDAPTDLTTIDPAWSEIGHTSLEDILAFASDGGDATTLGTLQKPVLKTAYSPRTESFTFNLAQFDAESLKLYFGSNMAPIAVGSDWLGVPLTPAPTLSAFLLVLTDGVSSIGLWAPQTELYRADDMSFSDTESIQQLPIQVKPLAYESNIFGYAWLPLQAA